MQHHWKALRSRAIQWQHYWAETLPGISFHLSEVLTMIYVWPSQKRYGVRKISALMLVTYLPFFPTWQKLCDHRLALQQGCYWWHWSGDQPRPIKQVGLQIAVFLLSEHPQVAALLYQEKVNTLKKIQKKLIMCIVKYTVAKRNTWCRQWTCGKRILFVIDSLSYIQAPTKTADKKWFMEDSWIYHKAESITWR